jgi:hypothetical protein
VIRQQGFSDIRRPVNVFSATAFEKDPCDVIRIVDNFF